MTNGYVRRKRKKKRMNERKQENQLKIELTINATIKRICFVIDTGEPSSNSKWQWEEACHRYFVILFISAYDRNFLPSDKVAHDPEFFIYFLCYFFSITSEQRVLDLNIFTASHEMRNTSNSKNHLSRTLRCGCPDPSQAPLCPTR